MAFKGRGACSLSRQDRPLARFQVSVTSFLTLFPPLRIPTLHDPHMRIFNPGPCSCQYGLWVCRHPIPSYLRLGVTTMKKKKRRECDAQRSTAGTTLANRRNRNRHRHRKAQSTSRRRARSLICGKTRTRRCRCAARAAKKKKKKKKRRGGA